MLIGSAVTFLMLGGGLALLITSIVRGKSSFGLFIVFPWVSTSDPLGMLGVLLMVGGFISLMITISLARFTFELGNLDMVLGEGYPKRSGKREASGSSVGGVILLGPIPIVFGSNRKVGRGMIYVMLIVTVIMVALFLLSLLAAFYVS